MTREQHRNVAAQIADLSYSLNRDMNLTDPVRYARSLAHLDRFRARGTYDPDAALRLLSGDVRAVARRNGAPVTGAQAATLARAVLSQWIASNKLHDT